MGTLPLPTSPIPDRCCPLCLLWFCLLVAVLWSCECYVSILPLKCILPSISSASWSQACHTCSYKQLIEALAELGRDGTLEQAGNKTLETTVSQAEPLAVPLR